MKVLTIHDLEAIKKRAENALLLREQSNEAVAEQCCGLAAGTKHLQILICGGTGCKASASHVIAEKLQQALEKNKITDQVNVITTGCFGFCEKGPIVKIIPDNTFYTQVTPEDAEEIVSEHIIGGRKIERLLYVDPKTEKAVSDSKHMDFYRKQMRIALRNCGFIDPENIEEYIGLNGYRALADSLLNGTPEAVIEEIKRSGLRGRGGGGFPTGRKWELASRQQADTKYVVCNADEGDPGAFMDRSIMEGDPHSIVEAMALCGYSIGSSKGLVYIRAEYPLAIQRLKTAIAQAREYGLLGDNIFGTGFCFDIEIRYGAGAFVCGEETALIHSMEGKRGEPTLKPPFPAESGYLGKPTNVNNVETLANIPIILTRGAEWFSTIGTEFSKGTKVFALAGKINNVGLIEVPMGTTLREVIYEIGGGIKGGKKFKAVQTGGPSGGSPGSGEMRGVWVSYLDWNGWAKDEAGYKKAMDQTLDLCVQKGLNAVFLQVRPDGDAMYPSQYFPWSKFASGKQGKNPGYDPLAYAVQAAHQRGLQLHAWINPYRITGYLNRYSDLCASNPAIAWAKDGDSSNDRWVLCQNGEYYYNPAIPQVRQLIIDGVKAYCDSFGVPFVQYETSFDPATDTRKSPCFLCSWNRRKALFTVAKEQGCNKIALGHHMDDILETLLMNITYQGAFSTMPPRLVMKKFDMTIIRPMCMVHEADLVELAALHDYRKQVKNCPYESQSSRSDMKGILRQLEAMNPEARYSLWGSMTNVQEELLPDKID